MKQLFKNWFYGFRFFRKCQHCKKQGACKYHQNTKYVDEKSNWKELCLSCKELNDEHWSDMWSDYYSNCM